MAHIVEFCVKKDGANKMNVYLVLEFVLGLDGNGVEETRRCVCTGFGLCPLRITLDSLLPVLVSL